MRITELKLSSLSKKVLVTIFLLVVCIVWNRFYCWMTDTESSYYIIDFMSFLLVMKEEAIFRYIPFMVATAIILLCWKLNVKKMTPIYALLIIAILVVQIVFALLHITWDENIREMVFQMPVKPEMSEYGLALSLQGVLGITLCVVYYLFINKRKPLWLAQLIPFIVCVVFHFINNIFVSELV